MFFHVAQMSVRGQASITFYARFYYNSQPVILRTAKVGLVGHGGENRAVFVYQLDSYRHWQQQLHRTDFTFG